MPEPENPYSPYEVGIGSRFGWGEAAIFITCKKSPREREILRLGKDEGRDMWEAYDGAIIEEPTLSLPDDLARALLDALLRHYQGASDMHTVRADLIAERKRSDKMIDALIGIAGRAATPLSAIAVREGRRDV